MLWVYLAIGTAILFTINALTFKKLVSKISPEVLNMYVWLFIGVFSFIQILTSNLSLYLTQTQTLLLIGASVLSFLGNFAYIRAFKDAQNTGYPVTIRSVQSPLIFLLAIVFLGAAFSLYSFVFLILVIAGVFFMQKTGTEKRKVFVLALTSAFFFSLMVLILTVLSKQISTTVFLFYNGVFLTVGFGAYLLCRKRALIVSGRNYLLLAGCAALALIGNKLEITALSLAPNPGYVTAITILQIPLVTVSSYLLFKGAISRKQIIGSVFIIAGILGIILSQ